MNQIYPSPLFLKVIAFLLFINVTSVQANPIPEFEAEYKVKIFYFTVGKAYQSMTCKNETCTIKNQAKPPKWAQKYINESVKEEITIEQTSENFIWKKYHKHLTRTYDDRPTRQIYTDLKVENSSITHKQSELSWPANNNAFDLISLAYAIQHKVLNKQNLNKFLLQDEESQTSLKLRNAFEYEELDLPIEDEIETELFEFRNGKINAKLWLAPKWQYFPVRLKLNDKQKDRTITLELSKLKLR